MRTATLPLQPGRKGYVQLVRGNPSWSMANA